TELSAHFLFIAMGFGSDEFIPLVGNKEAPAFVPQSEGYYPWAFYSVPTVHEDLMEVFHKRAMQYLHSDAAGRKTHVVITNFRALIVCDLRRYLPEYDLALSDLYDAIAHQTHTNQAQKALKAWTALLDNFGPSSSSEKKKIRRTEVIHYV